MKPRVDVKAILRDPKKRREMAVRCIVATQAREGITTTKAQAEAAYDKVQRSMWQTPRNKKQEKAEETRAHKARKAWKESRKP